MRCINCGRETEQGYWTSSGFLCSMCSESYGYFACEGCGLRFQRSKMKEYGGGTFCESCYRGFAPKPTPPKPKAPARVAAPVKMPVRKEKVLIRELTEVTPSIVQARALGVLRGQEQRKIGRLEYKERKKDVISGILFAIKDIIRGKYAKKKKHELEIK